MIRARSGDRDAFELLVRANFDKLYAVARRMMTDASDAEDATQDAFLRGWRDIPRLRDPDEFDHWQLRLLVNACYDLLRRRQRRALHTTVRALPDVGVVSEPDFLERERLGRAFAKLSPDHRSVLVLHFYRDMPAAEIATVLDVPVGTVNSRLHYGTRVLRAELEADERRTRAEAGGKSA